MIQDHSHPDTLVDMQTLHPKQAYDAGFEGMTADTFYKNFESVKPDLFTGAPRAALGARVDDPFAGYGGMRLGPSHAQAVQDAMAAIGPGIAVINVVVPERPIVAVNEAFQRITGYSAREAVGLNLSLLAGDDTDASAQHALWSAVERGEPATATLLHYDKSGSTFWDRVRVFPVRENDAIVAVACAIENVSDLHRAEQALQVSRERLESVIATLSELLVTVDSDYVMSFANAALHSVLGYDPDEVSGASWLSLVHPDDAVSVREWLDAGASGTPEAPIGFQAQHRDGSWRYLEATARLLPASAGAWQILISARDITDLMELRERQTTMLLEATINGQEEERERICLDIHDGICQTLATAFQYLETVQLDRDQTPEAYDRLRRGQDLVRHGIHQAREIVASLRPARLDALGLVTALKYDVQDLGERAGILTTFHAEPVRLASAVETAVYRVIHEALNNVVKHAQARTVAVTIGTEHGRLIVQVQDDGIGFRHSLAQPDVRLGGVGLISMRRRTELLQGRFDVSSVPGQGTVIRISVPLTAIAKQ